MAIQLKTIHPYKFLGEVREDLILIYAEDENGIRYNIAKQNQFGALEECASALCSYPLEEEYLVTNNKTENPQPLE